SWVITPGSGGGVCFVGVVREDSDGRPGGRGLFYEAYEEGATRRLAEIAAALRRRWPGGGGGALPHPGGGLAPSASARVVVVSAPHRAEAVEAARFGIDTLKETVPIWKREHWEGGSEWAATAHPARPVRPSTRTG